MAQPKRELSLQGEKGGAGLAEMRAFHQQSEMFFARMMATLLHTVAQAGGGGLITFYAVP